MNDHDAVVLPRSTRNRPLLEFPGKGIPVYINNINSPGALHQSDFIIQSASFLAHGVTCKVDHNAKEVCIDELNLKVRDACVEFWSRGTKPVLSLMVCIPLQWNATTLCQAIKASVQEHGFISLINSYTLMGVNLPFNTINNIHYMFKFNGLV